MRFDDDVDDTRVMGLRDLFDEDVATNLEIESVLLMMTWGHLFFIVCQCVFDDLMRSEFIQVYVYSREKMHGWSNDHGFG